jgi:hypothetical protein
MGSLRLPNRSKGLYLGPRGVQGRKARERLLSKGTLAMVRDPQPRRFYTSFGIREGENGVFLGGLGLLRTSEGLRKDAKGDLEIPKICLGFPIDL